MLARSGEAPGDPPQSSKSSLAQRDGHHGRIENHNKPFVFTLFPHLRRPWGTSLTLGRGHWKPQRSSHPHISSRGRSRGVSRTSLRIPRSILGASWERPGPQGAPKDPADGVREPGILAPAIRGYPKPKKPCSRVYIYIYIYIYAQEKNGTYAPRPPKITLYAWRINLCNTADVSAV